MKLFYILSMINAGNWRLLEWQAASGEWIKFHDEDHAMGRLVMLLTQSNDKWTPEMAKRWRTLAP